MAGNLNFNKEQVIKTLLVLSSLRGTDNTGVGVISKNYELKTAKVVGNVFDLLDTHSFNKAFYGNNSVVIGHSRFGTVGGNVKSATHPFDLGDIVGAHNGTINNKPSIPNHTLFTTDSEALLEDIRVRGAKEAIGNVGGAWALTWFDFRDGTLNFLRNKERELYIASDNQGVVYWASEKWMLSVALSRHKIEIGEIELIPENIHMKIGVEKNGELKEESADEVQGKTFVHTVVTTNIVSTNVVPLKPPNEKVSILILGKRIDKRECSYYRCTDKSSGAMNLRLYTYASDDYENPNIKEMFCKLSHPITDNKSGEIYRKVIRSSIEIVMNSKTYKDHKGKDVTEEEWMSRYPSCGWCMDPIDPQDDNKLTTEGEVICHHCRHDDTVTQYVKFANQ
jgi:hypothetical protein